VNLDTTVHLRENPRDRRLDPEARKVMASAREFEAVMLEQLLSSMRTTVGGSTQSSTMQSYREMLDGEMAREMSVSGGIGLADSIARELLHDAGLRPSTR
jgi:Rod binding domain-containing protein